MADEGEGPRSIAARVLPHRRTHPTYLPLDDGWYSAMVVDGMLSVHLGRSGSITGDLADFEIRPVGRRPRRIEADAEEEAAPSPAEEAAEQALRLAGSRWLEAHTVQLMLRLMTGGASRLCADRLKEVPERYRAGETPWEHLGMDVQRVGDPAVELVGCPTEREAEVLADILNRIELELGQELGKKGTGR